MAANLSHKDGKAEMFSGSGIVPWHGEGTVIQGRATAAQALSIASLDWTVEKFPIFYNGNAGSSMFAPVSIHNQFVTRRTDKDGVDSVLGIVGKNYEVVQNVDCFDFFDSIVDSNEAIYESAGALDSGRKVWILAKLPTSIKLKGDDIVDKYVLLATSHDGTMNLTAKLTGVRVVCQNTLKAAMSEKHETIRIRHGANAKDKIAEAARVLRLANTEWENAAARYNRMTEIKVDTLMIDYYLAYVIPSMGVNPTRAENVRQTIMELFESKGKGCTLDSSKGTAWGLYNAVTEYITHVKEYKKDTSRLDAVWFGSGNTMNNNAFECAMAFDLTPRSKMEDLVTAKKKKAKDWGSR
jgi:phage/plasmid-like protein (TIGR03299 family)